MTFRSCFRFVLSSALVLAARATALAQTPQMGPSMPLPLAVELAKVPVGSWSEYRITAGGNTMSVRMALVARSERAANVETQIKGGPIAAIGRTTVRMSLPLAPAEEIKPEQQVIQLGDNPPMLLPPELGGAHAQSFKKLDPKKRIGVESVAVAGGTFPQAEHYRDKAPGGETIDFWINKAVLPFGLLKVTSTSVPAPGSGDAGNSVAMELTGHGKGAKPAITKPPQPFDPAVIIKQTQAAVPGGSTPGAGPPPGMIPSPHPGMPPTSASGSPSGKARQDGKDGPDGKKDSKKDSKTDGKAKNAQSPQ